MIKSMTGFGRCEAADEERKFTVEMKGVNHRYLDANIRMPKKLNFFESAIRSLMDRHISFPVGRVEYMALHPCTFVEFLSAIGEEMLAEKVEAVDVPQSLHSYALELFKKYMIIGGLPEVVANYAQHRDMVRLGGIFNALLSGYRDDVEKYASKPKEQDSIRYILNYGWTSAAQTKMC